MRAVTRMTSDAAAWQSRIAGGPQAADAEIGRRIRRARKIAGLTQAELAEKVGISPEQFQKYEVGLNRISAATLTVVASALQVSAWSLLGDTGDAPLDPLDGLITAEGVRVLRALAKLPPELRVSFLGLIEAAARSDVL